MDARIMARSMMILFALTVVQIPITGDGPSYHILWQPAEPDRPSLYSWYAQSIVVNEAYPDPDTDVNGDGKADQNDEFIELFNSGGSSIDIYGWTLSDLSGTYSIPQLTMGVGDHISFGRAQTGLVLGSKENVTLRDDLGNTVDILGWEYTKQGFSIFRCPDGAQRIREKKAPTPSSANPLPPQVLINEVMPDPDGPNAGAQWLEILNVGEIEDLIGSRITNSESVDIYLPSLTLDPWERAVLCIGSSDLLGVHPPDVRTIELDCDKTFYVVGDDLQFLDPDGYLTDFVAWGNSSHVDPPLDIMDRVQWTGKLWDPENETMTASGIENPKPVSGRSLMRREDGFDSGSPEDLVSGSNALPCTPGWSNDLDPAVEIIFPTDLEFSASEFRELTISIIPRSVPDRAVLVNVSIGDPAWTLTGGGLRSLNNSGAAPIELTVGISSPVDLRNHTCSLRIVAYREDSVWFATSNEAMVLIPSCDLAFEDPHLLLDGDRVASVPEGAIFLVKGYVVNRGERATPAFDLAVELSLASGSILERTIALNPIKAGLRRAFSFEIDSLGWSGNLTICLRADPAGNVPEFAEENNRCYINGTIIPTPVLPGESGLVLERVLFNASAEARYAVITNPSREMVELGGIRIGDLEGFFILPAGAQIGPNSSISIAWGEISLDRIPAGTVVYRGDGEGAKTRQLERLGRIPDPLDSGVLVLETRYRKNIDTLKVGPCECSGWTDTDTVKMTFGTEARRIRDAKGRAIDSNTSLDWTCNGGIASLATFCPRPDPDRSTEFVSISFDGDDPSGFMLTCGGRAIVVPNGTPPSRTFNLAKDLEMFVSAQNDRPDCLFGYEEDHIPGAVVPGGGSFVLPDSGGNLSLWDPACRLLDSVSWGSDGIGKAGIDATYWRPPAGGGPDAWSHCGRASSDLSMDLLFSGLSGCTAATFDDPAAALSWVRGDGLMISRSDLPYDDLVQALTANPGDAMLYLDIPPWIEIPGYSGPMADRSERIVASLHLIDEGVEVRHPEEPGSGSGIFISCERRIVFIYGGWDVQGSFALGYELPDEGSAMNLTMALIGNKAEWTDSEETLRSHEPDLPVYVPKGETQPSPTISSMMGDLSVFPGPIPPSTIAESETIDIVDTNNLLDLSALLLTASKGSIIRLIVPSEPHPIADPEDDAYKTSLGLFDRGQPDLTPYDDDPFTRALAFQRIARERGFSLEVRMLPLSGGPSMPGLVITSGGTYSSCGDRDGPGNAFWVGIDAASRGTAIAFEGLWNQSMPVPEGMMGNGMIGSGEGRYGPLRIQEVYFDTYIADDPDEYIAIYNPGPDRVDLRGWTISDDEGELHDNDGTILFIDGAVAAGELFFIARNGSAFEDQNGFDADVAWEGTKATWALIRLSGEPVLTNGNDSVSLRDPQGWIADVVPFGRCIWDRSIWPHVKGGSWSGSAAPDPGWGHVLHRAVAWTGGRADTDTREDWLTMRPRYPEQTRFEPFGEVDGVPVHFASCPDASSDLLSHTISSSSAEICVNVYELWSDWIASALVGAVERGVKVRVLLEGSPVGGVSEMEKRAISTMVSVGIEVRLMWSDTASDSRDPYRYDHAKYMVSDGRTVLVSSDNFKDTSFPPPGFVPAFGTRGWVVTADSETLAERMLSVFDADWYGVSVRGAEEVLELPDMSSVPLPNIDLIAMEISNYRITGSDRSKVQILVSPDHLSVPDNPLLTAMGGAKDEVLCELLDLSEDFDLRTMDPSVYPQPPNGSVLFPGSIAPNPYLDALFAAAGNGAMVRMILDGTDFDSDGIPENLHVAEWVRSEASARGFGNRFLVELMPPEASLGPYGLGMIHNKGVVIDGQTVWVSSMNWGPTSALENREVGLLIGSQILAGSFQRAFSLDWGLTLSDEISVRKEGLIVEAINGTWVRVALTVTPTRMTGPNITLSLHSLDYLSMMGEYPEGMEPEWRPLSLGNSTIVEFSCRLVEGERRLFLIAGDGDRVCPLMTLNVSALERTTDDDWSYPFHRDPLFPLALMVLAPIAFAVAVALFRYRKLQGPPVEE